jgi:thiopeptide-type bacteriocin biosynthesis protein
LAMEIKIETNQREPARYSEELIEMAEAFFCAGSEWTVERLKSRAVQPANSDNGLENLMIVYRLVQVFLKDSPEILRFFKWRSDSFLSEFGGRKQLKIDLDVKWRLLGKDLTILLDNPPGAKSAKKLIQSLNKLSEASGGWESGRRNTLLADLIHMQVNRMFSTRQRQHEALIYFFLHKYTVSLVARRS